MSEPPQDWDKRFDALPGSELPQYVPSDERDDQARYNGGYDHDDFADDEYSGSDRDESGEEEDGSARLSIPTATPAPDRSVHGNRRNGHRLTGPIFQQTPGWQDYRQAQAPEGAYSPGAEESADLASKEAVKISLWGSPASGKTTFLAVLRHAAEGKGREADSDIGEWSVYPMNPLSTRLMANFTHELSQGNFPNPTLPGEMIPLQWLFAGDITDSKFVRTRNRFLRRGRIESKFVLDLVDVSGHAFGHVPDKERVPVPTHVADQALSRLIDADGIIYLFDPIGERDNKDSYSYVNRIVAELKYRAASDRYAQAHLKKQIAICITKFDDPAVFQEARRNGFVSFGDDGIPRVPDERAEDFFGLFCRDSFWRQRYEQSARSAEFIRRELRQVFSPENIKYYVTSSIGFYQPPGWRSREQRFDPNDFINVVQGAANSMPRIRGTIHPINVLEPLVSVHQRFVRRA